MKTKIILFLALMSSSMIYSQKHTFSSYGLVTKYTNGGVFLTPAKLSIEKIENETYQLIALDPRDGSVTINSTVKYKLFNSERVYYVYEGKKVVGQMEYNCIIRTKIKMSEFIQGKGNGGAFNFDKKYEIKMFYSRYGKTIDEMNETISIFPN